MWEVDFNVSTKLYWIWYTAWPASDQFLILCCYTVAGLYIIGDISIESTDPMI